MFIKHNLILFFLALQIVNSLVCYLFIMLIQLEKLFGLSFCLLCPKAPYPPRATELSGEYLNVCTSPFSISFSPHMSSLLLQECSKCIPCKSFACLFCHWIWSEMRKDLMYKPYSTPTDFLLPTTNYSVCMYVCLNIKNGHSASNKDICKYHGPKYLPGWGVYPQRR